jgi:hypothetical protein
MILRELMLPGRPAAALVTSAVYGCGQVVAVEADAGLPDR